MSNLFINDLGDVAEYTFSESVDDTKLGGVPDTSEGPSRGMWTGWRNGLTGTSGSSAKETVKSCAWGRTTCLGMVSLAEKTMGVLGNTRLNMNKKFALATVDPGLHQARYCQKAE